MDPQDTFLPCPSCLTFISPMAHVCPTCKVQALGNTGVSPEELAQAKKAIAELTAAASAPPDLTGQPGRFRIASHVAAAMFVASIVIAAAGANGIRALGVVLAIIPGVSAIVMYIGDLAFPAVRERASGLQAVQCYFKAVKSKRWSAAFSCLSSIARARTPRVPPMPELRCASMPVPFATAGGVKRYWSSFAQSNLGMNRWIKSMRFRPIATTPDVETYAVDLQIGYIKDLVDRKTRSMSFPVTVIKHRSQWWLLTGEIYPRLDRALLAPAAAASGQAS
jgi:hypothetical protein